MNGKQSLTSRFNILSRNVQGLTPEKEHILLLELIDQVHLDLVFIQKPFVSLLKAQTPNLFSSYQEQDTPSWNTWARINEEGFSFELHFIWNQCFCNLFCEKSEILEIPAIEVQKMIFLRTYIPDGRSPEGIKQWIEIMDSLEAKYRNSAIISLGDLNCTATALGNLRTNESSPF